MDFSWLQHGYIFLATTIGEVFGTLFGGGSFFIQPALLAANIPPHIAIANDIASATFTNFAFLWFYRKQPKQFTLKNYASIMTWMAPALILGAVFGAHIMHALSENFLRILIVTICSLGLGLMVKNYFYPAKEKHVAEKPYPKLWPLYVILSAILIGLYDGLSGAGSGILIILLLTLIFKRNIKSTLALANIVSAISLTSAGVTFLFLGLLVPSLLLTMIPACLLAGALAAKFAVLLPERALRLIYMALITALIVYLASHIQ